MRSTRLDSGARLAYEEEAIAHWIEKLGEALTLISPNLSEVSVCVSEAPAQVLASLAKGSPLISLNLYFTIRVRARVTFDETRASHPTNAGPIEEIFWPSFLSFYLGNAFQIACLAAHISRPGALSLDHARTFIEDQCIESIDGTFRLEVSDTEEDLGNMWPSLKPIDLVKVVHWFKAISAFSPPIATTRFQRALAAFTYLVGHGRLHTYGEVLFRAMQGLESFYCDGIGDLRKQMSEKTQLWLGLSSSPSNLVGKLYDLRSKYVHGSAPMPYAVCFEDPDEHSPKAMREFYDGVILATRLLVATLQRCVSDEVTDIQWGYNFQNVPRKSVG